MHQIHGDRMSMINYPTDSKFHERTTHSDKVPLYKEQKEETIAQALTVMTNSRQSIDQAIDFGFV